MYQKIMVPLDGSELAECVLPHLETISRSCSLGEARLVRVVEPFYLPHGALGNSGAFPGTWGVLEEQRRHYDATAKDEAKKYLDGVAKRLKLGDLTAKTEVLMGKAAETLAEYATKAGVDLIIISTHGRSGVSRWIWGSVADRILRAACVPVLMVRAPGCVVGV